MFRVAEHYGSAIELGDGRLAEAEAPRANVPADEIVEVGAGTPEFSGRLRDRAAAQADA
ncbi:MAG: hypothetical protein ACXWZM_04265 [Solirubrobacterales bacterium]